MSAPFTESSVARGSENSPAGWRKSAENRGPRNKKEVSVREVIKHTPALRKQMASEKMARLAQRLAKKEKV
jgi:hypothetical protein